MEQLASQLEPAEGSPEKPNLSAPPESSPASNLDMEALKLRAQVMREDPAIRTVMEIVRHTPEVWAEVRPVLTRREEMIAGTQLEGQHHRDFAPLLAGIALSERAAQVMDVAMDRSFAAQSEWIKGEIMAGNNYVHELLIGSGLHSAIYNSARMLDHPGHPALVVEQEDRVGGQFAIGQEAAFYLNSRTRPENTELPHRPGTEGNLNTMVEGVLQPSDLSNRAYISQDELARAVRVDHLMASKVVTGLTLTELGSNPNFDGQRGELKAVFVDRATGQSYEILTDRVVGTTGLGESRTLDNVGRRTERIIRQEQEKLARGEQPQVITAEDLIRLIGDPTNTFPLKGLNRVAIVGPNDTGRVAAEYLLGYGPRTRKSVTQLDRIKSLVWYGQKAKTKEEFERQERQRYRDLGLEFPRESDLNYYYRITPIEEKASRLERADGKIVVGTGSGEEEGFDLVVLATGLEDKLGEILEGLEKPSEFITDPEEVKSRAAEIIKSAGEIATDRGVIYALGDLDNVRDEYVINDSGSETVVPVGELETFLAQLLHQREVRYGFTPLSGDINVYKDDQGRTIARKVTGREVYLGGPAANIPVSEAEIAETPVLGMIPENSAAIFRYAELTAELAHDLARKDGQLGPDLVSSGPQHQLIEMSPLPDVDSAELVQPINLARANEVKLSSSAVIEDLVRFSVAERLFHYRLPGRGMQLTFRRSGDSYTMQADERMFSTSGYPDMLEHLLSDPVLQQMIQRLTDKHVTTDQTAVLTIPFRNTRVDMENVTARPVRSR